MEHIVWPAGLKRTRPRKLVWQVLTAADRPLEVKEIYRRLETEDLAMSTVYRVLAAFEEAALVSRTTVMGEETALYSLRRAGHVHYAICLRCRRQVPLPHCPFERVPVETADGFAVTGHRLELYGYCRSCQNTE